jgi:hypothetical protein
MPAGGKSRGPRDAERIGALLSGAGEAQIAKIAPDGGGADALVQPDDYDSDMGWVGNGCFEVAAHSSHTLCELYAYSAQRFPVAHQSG